MRELSTYFPPKAPGNAGFSLLWAMMFIAILGIFAEVAMLQSDIGNRELELAARSLLTDELRLYARWATDCNQTMMTVPAVCPAGRVIILKGRDGASHDVSLTDGQKLSGRVRATCTGAGRDFSLQYSADGAAWKNLSPGKKYRCPDLTY